MGDQIRIPRVVRTFLSFFLPTFSKAILRRAELVSLCNVVSFIYQLFVPHFAMAVFKCIYLIPTVGHVVRILLYSDLSTVDLSKH